MNVLELIASKYCVCGGKFIKVNSWLEVCDKCGLRRITRGDSCV